jgi:hypothetical protein
VRDPAARSGELDDLGEQVHEKRREFAMRHGVGLTETYKSLHDAAQDDTDLVALRRLHETLDQAVLDACGWRDVVVPSYTAANDTLSAEHDAFEDVVAGRLFKLNAERAASAERAPGQSKKPEVHRAKPPGPSGPKGAMGGPGRSR